MPIDKQSVKQVDNQIQSAISDYPQGRGKGASNWEAKT